MPLWFFLLLAVLLAAAVILAVAMGFGRSAGGQNTTIIERGRRSEPNTTVVERD